MQRPRKINLQFLIDEFFGPGAGTERHLYALATGLDKSRFHVGVIYFNGNDYHAANLRRCGIETVHLALGRIYAPSAALKALRLMSELRKRDIDILQTYHFKSDTFGVLVARACGVSTIVSSKRDTGELRRPRQVLLQRLCNRFVSRFIMVSDRVGEKVGVLERIPAQQSLTIYNGVDLARFSAPDADRRSRLKADLKIGAETFVVGTTAVFRSEKGYDVLLAAVKAASVYISDWKVVLLGDGPMLESCKRFVREAGLENVVAFPGYVEDVAPYLSLLDVFCLVPRSNEGLSNAMLEAMAAGKPVICTDVGGNAEAVLHDVTGLVVPAGDVAGLTRALTQLHDDPAQRRRMGERAQRRAEESFSLDTMIRRHEELYQDLVRAR